MSGGESRVDLYTSQSLHQRDMKIACTHSQVQAQCYVLLYHVEMPIKKLKRIEKQPY